MSDEPVLVYIVKAEDFVMVVLIAILLYRALGFLYRIIRDLFVQTHIPGGDSKITSLGYQDKTDPKGRFHQGIGPAGCTVLMENWAGSVQWSPDVLYAPTNVSALREIVSEANKAGKKIRVVGARHSWSNLAVSKDINITLDNFDRVATVDSVTSTVRVGAGTRLYDLAKALKDQGYALPVMASVSAQSLAGAIMTGTHATGRDFPAYAGMVQEVVVVNADGSLATLTRSSATQERFQATLVSLGVLGVIVEFVMDVVPTYRLEMHETPGSWAKTFRPKFDALAEEADHAKIWLWPTKDFAVHYTWSRVPTSGPGSVPTTWFLGARIAVFDKFLQVVAGVVLPWVRAVGNSYPAVRDAPVSMVISSKSKPVHKVSDTPSQIHNTPVEVKHFEMEYSFPVEKAKIVLDALTAYIVKGWEAGQWNVDFPVEVRWVAKDDSWLSMAHGRDSVFIGVLFIDRPDMEAAYPGIEALFQAHGGRPHWGKRHGLHFQLEGIHAAPDGTVAPDLPHDGAKTSSKSSSTDQGGLRQRGGNAGASGNDSTGPAVQVASFATLYPRWADFCSTRAALDPKGTFLNAETEALFFHLRTGLQ